MWHNDIRHRKSILLKWNRKLFLEYGKCLSCGDGGEKDYVKNTNNPRSTPSRFATFHYIYSRKYKYPKFITRLNYQVLRHCIRQNFISRASEEFLFTRRLFQWKDLKGLIDPRSDSWGPTLLRYKGVQYCWTVLYVINSFFLAVYRKTNRGFYFPLKIMGNTVSQLGFSLKEPFSGNN